MVVSVVLVGVGRLQARFGWEIEPRVHVHHVEGLNSYLYVEDKQCYYFGSTTPCRGVKIRTFM